MKRVSFTELGLIRLCHQIATIPILKQREEIVLIG
jgi:hypothetical protein